MENAIDFQLLNDEPWDCLIIGAGLAGTAAALRLSQLNLRVLLVERARFPRDKVCGGCLNQRAIDILMRLGMRDAVVQAGAVSQAALELATTDQRIRLAVPTGLSISRAALDTLMSEAVIDAGGCFVDGTKAVLGDVDGGHRIVTLYSDDGQKTVRARTVLAADGLHGGTLRSAGHEPRIAADARVGAGTVLPAGSVRIEPGVIRMAIAVGGYVGAAMVEAGRIDVAAAFDPSFLRECNGPADAANKILMSAGYAPVPVEASTKWKGTPPLTRRATVLGAERVLVLGDAAGYIEPFTGEGMAWALTSGYAVAPLVEHAVSHDVPLPLQEWRNVYRGHVGSRQLVCRGVATLLRYPLAVRMFLRALGWQPGLATPLIRYINTPAF
ncbi:MAG: FAD-binding protein [Candidatus Hydrogenedens sp.]|nr:FAD-binding protein [Candidatus Hydrogenedens sp.]